MNNIIPLYLSLYTCNMIHIHLNSNKYISIYSSLYQEICQSPRFWTTKDVSTHQWAASCAFKEVNFFISLLGYLKYFQDSTLVCPEKQQVAQNYWLSYIWVNIYLKRHQKKFGEFSCIFEERPPIFVFTPIFWKNTPVIRVRTIFLK